MLFQDLNNLKTSIPQSVISEYIFWLNSLSPMYRKNINPADYAIQKNINLDLAIRLFDLAVSEKVLKSKIIVEDENGYNYGTFYSNSDIPASFHNYEYDTIFNISEENKKILFELIDKPIFFMDNNKKMGGDDIVKGNVTVREIKKTGALAIMEELSLE